MLHRCHGIPDKGAGRKSYIFHFQPLNPDFVKQHDCKTDFCNSVVRPLEILVILFQLYIYMCVFSATRKVSQFHVTVYDKSLD